MKVMAATGDLRSTTERLDGMRGVGPELRKDSGEGERVRT